MRGHQHARADQRAGLERVQSLELGQRQRAAFGGEVERLPAGHAGGAARVGERLDHAHADRGVGRQARMRRQQLEGQHLQRIAGQDRRRFVERLVAGRPAAAQVVVVHGRQVVVHQRVAVNQLDGAGRGVDAARAARRASAAVA